MAIALMHLDVGTLSVVSVFVTALLGALLVFAGVQNRNIRAPMWWGGAQIVGAIGLGLAASSDAVPTFVSADIANALVLLGYGLTWAGARVFDGRPVLRPVVLFAPVVWFFACRIPAFENDANLRVAAMSTMTAMLAAATAEEFWRGRDEPLLSRWPTVIVLLAYAAVLLARIPATFFSPSLDDGSVLSGLSFALIAFGTLLFTVVMSFLLLNMTKERTELQHKINAMVDPLSGVANRRAFLDGARRLLAQQAIDGEPLAMMLFDLDRFKDINDRMGHAVGDRVLQTFATSSTLTLGADILFGRIGGEEFAALFPVGDLGEAYAVADRVRRNFAAAAQRFANDGLEPTVSVGVTVAVNPPAQAATRSANNSSKDPTTSMDLLLEVADRALYRAKANGRNRVEATAALDENITPLASAPSIVPLIKAERVSFGRARGWRSRAIISRFDTKVVWTAQDKLGGLAFMLLSVPNTPITLDVTTTIIVGTCVTALLGLFLLSAWAQERIRALAWWGTAYLLGGFSVAAWSIESLISPPLPAGIANALLFLACGMIWSAARIFHGRPVLWGAMAAGAAVWVAACMLEDFARLMPVRIILSSLIVAGYTFLTATELWRERRKSVLRRWPAIFVPILHGSVFLIPIPLAVLLPAQRGIVSLASGWIAVFALETMLYVVGTAFIVLVLANERSLRMQKKAALTDELTGSLNRRGFFAAAQQLLSQQLKAREPVSVLMFDLDHFKSINDRFGHQTGDETLKLFGAIARSTLRSSDVFARFGGEEFVAILPGSLADATVAAERVRLTFQGAAGSIAGSPVAATVSVGAASADLGADIAGLLTAADQALYRAKANGRNRVEGVEQKVPALSGSGASALVAAAIWHVEVQPSPAGGR